MLVQQLVFRSWQKCNDQHWKSSRVFLYCQAADNKPSGTNTVCPSVHAITYMMNCAVSNLVRLDDQEAKPFNDEYNRKPLFLFCSCCNFWHIWCIHIIVTANVIIYPLSSIPYHILMMCTFLVGLSIWMKITATACNELQVLPAYVESSMSIKRQQQGWRCVFHHCTIFSKQPAFFWMPRNHIQSGWTTECKCRKSYTMTWWHYSHVAMHSEKYCRHKINCIFKSDLG